VNTFFAKRMMILSLVFLKMNSFLRESKCLNSYLHRFEIIGEYESGVLEVCQICKKAVFFKLIDGKVNNLAYMDWHIRNALPQNHPLYYHEFHFEPLNELVSPYYGN